MLTVMRRSRLPRRGPVPGGFSHLVTFAAADRPVEILPAPRARIRELKPPSGPPQPLNPEDLAGHSGPLGSRSGRRRPFRRSRRGAEGAHFARFRSPISVEADHSFRSKPIIA